MSDWASSEHLQNGHTAADDKETQLSISDWVTQTATQVVQQQHSEQFASLGFHWVEEWALFYNAESGYFYDQNAALFFHPSAPQLYYKYNADTGQYDRIGPGGTDAGPSSSTSAAKWSKKAFQRRANRLFGDDFVQSARQEDVEVAELTLDLVDRCSFLVSGECSAGAKRSRKRTLTAMMAMGVDDELSEWRPPAYHSAVAGGADFDSPNEDSDEDSSSDSERLNEEIARRQREEEIARNAPCIRLVERPRGRLHIVTICGARVGFGRAMDVQIGGGDTGGPAGSTASASAGGEAQQEEELLLSIQYSPEEGVYRTEWHSCAIYAEKDGHCLEAGVSHTVRHEDVITVAVGAAVADHGQHISLSFHIHSGLNTCQGCEPGLFSNNEQSGEDDALLQRPKKRLSRYAEHRRQMRALKEQYGLLGEDPAEAMGAELHKKYVDRAGRRRREVGSELTSEALPVLNRAGGIYAHCVATPQPGCSSDSVLLQQRSNGHVEGVVVGPAATTAVPINAENKGFKLLKGMGWTEGQGLGKHSQGIKGPIATQFKADRVGLGTAVPSAKKPFASSKISIQLVSKQQRNAEQMRKRIEQIEARQMDNK